MNVDKEDLMWKEAADRWISRTHYILDILKHLQEDANRLRKKNFPDLEARILSDIDQLARFYNETHELFDLCRKMLVTMRIKMAISEDTIAYLIHRYPDMTPEILRHLCKK